MKGSYLVLRIGLSHPLPPAFLFLAAFFPAWLLASLPACLLAWLPACLAGCLPACRLRVAGPAGGLAGGVFPSPIGNHPDPRIVIMCKYAVKVDVDLATLQQNRRFL